MYVSTKYMQKGPEYFFFGGGGTGCGRWEGIPTIAAPNIFFDAAEWPQALGGGQGKAISHNRYTRVATRSPGIPVGPIPAIYPYLEYPVTPFGRVPAHPGH
jgi:hypothetical protein